MSLMCLMNVGSKQKRDMYIHEKMMLEMMVVMLFAAVVWWVN